MHHVEQKNVRKKNGLLTCLFSSRNLFYRKSKGAERNHRRMRIHVLKERFDLSREMPCHDVYTNNVHVVPYIDWWCKRVFLCYPRDFQKEKMPKRMYPLSRVESIEWNAHVIDWKMCELIDQEDWDKHSQGTIFEKKSGSWMYLLDFNTSCVSFADTHSYIDIESVWKLHQGCFLSKWPVSLSCCMAHSSYMNPPPPLFKLMYTCISFKCNTVYIHPFISLF